MKSFKKSKWDSPNEKVLIKNVPLILPPRLPENLKTAILLRAQLEEIRYKLDKIDEEYRFLIDNSSLIIQDSSKSKKSTEIIAKTNLLQERRLCIASIESFYPVFIPPIQYRYTISKVVKEIKFNSKFVTFFFADNKGLKAIDIEKEFSVRLKFNSSDSSIAVIGVNEQDVDDCIEKIKRYISSFNPDLVKVDDNKLDYSSNINEYNVEAIYPWTDISLNSYKSKDDDVLLDEINELKKLKNTTNDDTDNDKEQLLTLEQYDRHTNNITAYDISFLLPEPSEHTRNE